MWQDYLFMVGNVVFSLSLVPAIRKNNELMRCDIPYITSVLTSLILYSYAIAFLTLPIRLYLAFMFSCLTASVWAVLSLQRLFYSGDWLRLYVKLSDIKEMYWR